MGDLLDRAREFSFQSFTKEEAQRLFVWNVIDVAAVRPEPYKSTVIVAFEGGLTLEIKYYLNPELGEAGDTCEFTLGLKTDLISKVAYNIFYSGYIHGQGYIRLTVAQPENPIARRIVEDIYTPGLKDVYRPIIENFRGFRSKDYFGVRSGSQGSQVYYSGVTARSDNKDVLVSDVVERLHALDGLLKEPEIRRSLAELDLQISFLPDMVWS